MFSLYTALHPTTSHCLSHMTCYMPFAQNWKHQTTMKKKKVPCHIEGILSINRNLVWGCLRGLKASRMNYLNITNHNAAVDSTEPWAPTLWRHRWLMGQVMQCEGRRCEGPGGGFRRRMKIWRNEAKVYISKHCTCTEFLFSHHATTRHDLSQTFRNLSFLFSGCATFKQGINCWKPTKIIIKKIKKI